MRWAGRKLQSRRLAVVVTLVALVALFAGRAVVHHLADDAVPPAATTHHEAADHGLSIDAVMGAAGFLLLGAALLGLGLLGRSSPQRLIIVRRLRRSTPRPPRATPRRGLRLAELQSFLM